MVADLKNTQDVAIRNPITGEYAETGGPSDPVNTKIVDSLGNSVILPIYSDVTLQDAETETADGTEVNITGYKGILISLFGINITSSTVVFEVNDADDNWTSVLGVKVGTETTATSTSGIATGTNTPGEKWFIALEGCTQFRSRISAIAGEGATLTVKGRMVL